MATYAAKRLLYGIRKVAATARSVTSVPAPIRVVSIILTKPSSAPAMRGGLLIGNWELSLLGGREVAPEPVLSSRSSCLLCPICPIKIGIGKSTTVTVGDRRLSADGRRQKTMPCDFPANRIRSRFLRSLRGAAEPVTSTLPPWGNRSPWRERTGQQSCHRRSCSCVGAPSVTGRCF